MAPEESSPRETTPLISTMTSKTQDAAKFPSQTVVDEDESEISSDAHEREALEKTLRLKVDIRLCTIAGILSSLNLLDASILSSASVTSMPADLSLTGSRYSVAIFIFAVTSIVFQLPSTLAVRFVGPRIWFALITCSVGFVTLSTAFIHNWRQMIALRVLLGISMSGIYPGLTFLISTWYTRKEQQLRFAFLRTGEIILIASGSILNYALNHLDGRAGLAGWRWMFLFHGSLTCCMGIITYWWMIDFPDRSHLSFRFLTEKEARLATSRIEADRADSALTPFSWRSVTAQFLDPKLYGFCILFFLLTIVGTSLGYFLPIILHGMGFSSNKAILLSAPPFYFAIIPVLLSSWFGDRYGLRGPVIAFSSLTFIIGFCMLGLSSQATVRYIGIFIVAGALISNWAALSAYQTNNIVGQWKRATMAAAVTASSGFGSICGSFIVKQNEAPRYTTAIWVSLGTQIAMLAVVGVFTFGFWRANRKQKSGKALLEGVEGWRYTY